MEKVTVPSRALKSKPKGEFRANTLSLTIGGYLAQRRSNHCGNLGPRVTLTHVSLQPHDRADLVPNRYIYPVDDEAAGSFIQSSLHGDEPIDWNGCLEDDVAFEGEAQLQADRHGNVTDNYSGVRIVGTDFRLDCSGEGVGINFGHEEEVEFHTSECNAERLEQEVAELKTRHELGGDVSPERNMWRAVILLAIKDTEKILEGCQSNIEKYGCCSPVQKRELMSIIREISSEWFDNVCGFAELHRDDVFRAIDNLRKQYGVKDTDFLTWDQYEEIKQRIDITISGGKPKRRRQGSALS